LSLEPRYHPEVLLEQSQNTLILENREMLYHPSIRKVPSSAQDKLTGTLNSNLYGAVLTLYSAYNDC
jgi:hypothetical protein